MKRLFREELERFTPREKSDAEKRASLDAERASLARMHPDSVVLVYSEKMKARERIAEIDRAIAARGKDAA